MADIEALLHELTVDEKAELTAGGDMFSTAPVERLGIPRIHVTDGPNGARGLAYPGIGGDASTCIPCGSALGATWDPELVQRLGTLVGAECLDRGCRGLLAPTVNLHRSPLAGRNFECYSEDPLLSGRLAAAYIRGVQSQGVFATVKHFVGNEAEYERNSISSVIDERTLRELYLVPFEHAVCHGGVLAVMTAYNRLNGSWLTEQGRLLTDILRGEWGFDGFVMTDWFGVVSSEASLAAGLDLEMPGPGRALGAGVAELVRNGGIRAADLDDSVRRMLNVFDRCGALGVPAPPARPKPLEPGDRDLVRRSAAAATVLLCNDGILPLELARLRRIAVIGDHAATPRIQGGGSAQVVQRPVISPLEALASAVGQEVEVDFARGCEVDRSATPLGRSVLPAPGGFVAEVFEGFELKGDVVHRRTLDELRFFVYNAGSQGYPEGDWSMRVRGTVVPEESGLFELALSQTGRARVLLDGQLVLDGFENPPPPGGSDFFGFASQELACAVELVAGVPVEVVVEYGRIETLLAGLRLGYRTVDAEGLLSAAVVAAGGADVAVVFVGTTQEWETEGRDRTTLALPGLQDELVSRVAAANPRTVVVINAGAPVDMPWADDVAAVLQCWFGGEEMGSALGDLLTGVREPGGRLPMTIPRRLEHSPSHDNFPGENGELRYGEGLFMGYRGFEHRDIEPRYPFGHGLGYTSFALGDLVLSAATFSAGGRLTISVNVSNVGARTGSEVVQCYVAPQVPRLARPRKELKAFARVHLEPGQSTVVEFEFDDRSFAYWDPGQKDWTEVAGRFSQISPQLVEQERRSPGWQIDQGTYQILVGRSSTEILRCAVVDVVAG